MTMEELLKNAATQVPGLVVLCYLVSTFLRAQKERDGFIHMMHQEHLAARGESREAIKENTESNREVTQAVHTLAEGLRDSHRRS